MVYRYSPQRKFKRPIRSFRDLGIYQSTNSISVEIMKKVVPLIPDESSLKKDLAECCMKIPHYIAEAHSRRFDDKEKAMKLLEETLFLCNKVVVYLEQTRDIYGVPVSPVSAGRSEVDPAAPVVKVKTVKTKPVPTASPVIPIGVDKVLVDEIIKRYFYTRQKVFNFYKAWKRFDAEDEKMNYRTAERCGIKSQTLSDVYHLPLFDI